MCNSKLNICASRLVSVLCRTFVSGMTLGASINKLKISTGKENGKRRMRFLMCGIVVCNIVCTLCGCTRREQLVLETAGQAQQISASKEAADDSGLTAPEGSQEEEDRQENQEQAGSANVKEKTDEQSSAGDIATGQMQQRAGENTMICVHVCGAVEKAGVYELPAGSRVYEAVRAAGGFAENADESYVNQAQQLADGSKLVIPSVEQVRNVPENGGTGTEQIGIVEQAALPNGGENTSVGAGNGTEADGKVNINTASETQLCEIPGIGATRAAAIMAYRQEHGSFHSIEEIMNVSGIKEGTYAKIKDCIKVN